MFRIVTVAAIVLSLGLIASVSRADDAAPQWDGPELEKVTALKLLVRYHTEEVKRAKVLFERKFVSRLKVQQAEAKLAAARAKLAVAEKELQGAKVVNAEVIAALEEIVALQMERVQRAKTLSEAAMISAHAVRDVEIDLQRAKRDLAVAKNDKNGARVASEQILEHATANYRHAVELTGKNLGSEHTLQAANLKLLRAKLDHYRLIEDQAQIVTTLEQILEQRLQQLERVKRLHAQGITSKQTLNEARIAIAEAKLELARAKAAAGKVKDSGDGIGI